MPAKHAYYLEWRDHLMPREAHFITEIGRAKTPKLLLACDLLMIYLARERLNQSDSTKLFFFAAGVLSNELQKRGLSDSWGICDSLEVM